MSEPKNFLPPRIVLVGHPSSHPHDVAEKLQLSSAQVVELAGPVDIDLAARTVWVSGTELELSRTEYDLIAVLADNAGRIMTRRGLLDAVWGGWFGDDHVIDVSLSRLRRKLSEAGVDAGLITTHRGLGYRFNA